MRAVRFFIHLFSPQESNNHKARAIHTSSLTFLILAIFLYQIGLEILPHVGVRVLGYAANISPDEVIRLTNEKRLANGLSPVTLNPLLSQAAGAKGADMLNKDYWAHVSPDGIEPWKFFKDEGYSYHYAGENLARDFSNPASVVDAWIASKSHRDNLLSPKYKEIGIAVVEGDLSGVDTTLVIQFFGTKFEAILPPKPVSQLNVEPAILPTIKEPSFILKSSTTLAKESGPVLISPFTSTKKISLVLILSLTVIFFIDWLIVTRKGVYRVGGKPLAHIGFLGMIVAIVLIAKGGQIL